MKTIQLKNNFVSLKADNGYTIRKVGTADIDTNIISQVAVKANEIDTWEEVSIETIEIAKKEEEKNKLYKEQVVKSIREKYDQDDENAIVRKAFATLYAPSKFTETQKESIITEFQEYNTFVEKCKQEAKMIDYGMEEISAD